MRPISSLLIFTVLLSPWLSDEASTVLASAQAAPLNVHLDVTQVQQLAQLPLLWQWMQNGRAAMVKFYPTVLNLLGTEGYKPPDRVFVIMENKDKGVAGTLDNRIFVSSGYIIRQGSPDIELGVLIHELVHVVQSYTNRGSPPKPKWVIEGVADYVRWPFFDKRPATGFPVPTDPNGFRLGYQVTAGFLLWIENFRSAGFVRRLHSTWDYSDAIFKQVTGKPVEALWAEYQAWRGVV